MKNSTYLQHLSMRMISEIFNIMKNDKKNSFLKINLVLPVDNGRVKVFDNIKEELILKVIKECNNA